eukprot:scaffold1071_cov166-Amphora_coffeaeformis.AAC.15
MFRCLKSGLSFSESVEIDVPADIVWETVADLEALPRVVSTVTAYERVSGSPPVPGSRFREIRLHRDREFTLLKTVTELKDNPETEPVGQRWLSLGINFVDPNGADVDTINTSTLIVVSVDDKSSRLILTGAFQSGTCLDHINNWCCYPCIKSLVTTSSAQELEDYRVAAMERHQKRNNT